MTYSCCDFTDDVFAELHRVGAITETEANDENLADNASLQANYALAGIGKLVKARDDNAALLLGAREIINNLLRLLHPGAVGLIRHHHGDDRGQQACAVVMAAKAFLNRGSEVQVLSGYFGYEGTVLHADFQVSVGATVAEKDSAFMAALAQQADIDYHAVGESDKPL